MPGLPSSQPTGDDRREADRARRELALFALLAGLGTVFSFLVVNIPHTEVHIDGRFIFAFIGFVLFRHWGPGLLLAVVLAVTGPHKVPLAVALGGNLTYLVPWLIALRLLDRHLMHRLTDPLTQAVGWLLIVLVGYQVFTTPAIWAVLAHLDGRPIGAGILEGWARQPFLIESLLVGVVVAAALTTIRTVATLARHHHQLEVILASIGEAVVVTDRDGRVVRLNPAARAMLGPTVGAAPGRPLRELVTLTGPDRQTLHPDPVGEALDRGGPVGLPDPLHLDPGNGEARLITGTVNPLLEDDGRTVGAVAVLRDVTERRHAAAALEQTVAALSRSNADLEQFAHVSAHDLREPLRMVGSYLQLLVRRHGRTLPAEAQEYIGFAVDGARRMDDLIRDILDYATVETQGAPFVPVALDEVLAEVVKTLEPTVREARARIEIDPLPTVHGDHAQLGRLFQNLLSNALKYRAPDRPPRIRVGARRDGATQVIAVEDNGIGIDPAFFERIFGMFQRLHGRETHDGTGVGLTLCKRIVERHGGTIRVQSTPGEGSTFLVDLPAAPG